jgi:hypothetical protein
MAGPFFLSFLFSFSCCVHPYIFCDILLVERPVVIDIFTILTYFLCRNKAFTTVIFFPLHNVMQGWVPLRE